MPPKLNASLGRMTGDRGTNKNMTMANIVCFLRLDQFRGSSGSDVGCGCNLIPSFKMAKPSGCSMIPVGALFSSNSSFLTSASRPAVPIVLFVVFSSISSVDYWSREEMAIMLPTEEGMQRATCDGDDSRFSPSQLFKEKVETT